MCGRFVSATPLAKLAAHFGVDDVRAEELPASYNVAPTDPVYGIAEHEGKRAIGTFRWGLVPPQGPRPINARAETLLQRSLFRQAFARRRCLLPTDGFYEWRAETSGAQAALPHLSQRRWGPRPGRPVVEPSRRGEHLQSLLARRLSSSARQSPGIEARKGAASCAEPCPPSPTWP
jgi:hypothetical protein